MPKTIKTIFFGVILIFTGIISGCGNKEKDIATDVNAQAIPENISSENISSAELHYRESDIPIPDDFVPTAVTFLPNEVFLFDGRTVLVINHEGQELEKTVLSKNEKFAAFDIQPDRSFWAVSIDFGEREAVSGTVPDAFRFVHIAQDGTEITRVRAEGAQFGKNENFVYPNRLLVDGGTIYLMSLQSVYVLDQSGQLVREFQAAGKNQKVRGEGMFKSLLKLNGGEILLASLVYGMEASSSLIQMIDPVNQKSP